jgi:hypothetical protein
MCPVQLLEILKARRRRADQHVRTMCSKKNQHSYPLPDHEPMPTKIDFLNSSIDTWLVRQTKWEMHIKQHIQPAMPSSSVKSTILFARCSMFSFWRHSKHVSGAVRSSMSHPCAPSKIITVTESPIMNWCLQTLPVCLLFEHATQKKILNKHSFFFYKCATNWNRALL